MGRGGKVGRRGWRLGRKEGWEWGWGGGGDVAERGSEEREECDHTSFGAGEIQDICPSTSPLISRGDACYGRGALHHFFVGEVPRFLRG